jgi:hypothetical protein
MDSDLIKKIFNDYYGKDFDLYGLKISLFDVSGDHSPHFRFIFENTNDVSYHRSIIEEHLILIVEEFSLYVNIESFKLRLLLNDEQKEFYLNNNLRGKIQKVFDEINYIEFGYQESYNITSKIRIYGESTGIVLYWDVDNYVIDNKFKPTRATIDGDDTDISSAISTYNSFMQDKETYWETENIYSKVDSIILESRYPLLVMDGYASYFDTKFV